MNRFTRFTLLISLVLLDSATHRVRATGQEPTRDGQVSGAEESGVSVQAEATVDGPPWVDVFAESPLSDWRRVGGRAEFEEIDRILVATIRAGHQTTFLCGDKVWGDFELNCQFRIDPGLNAGILIRSRPDSGRNEERVEGLQVEIDSSERGWTGALYDQGRKSWLATLEARPEVRGAFKQDQWNSLRVLAKGDSVTTWVNDVLAVSVTNSPVRSGIMAIQIHSTKLTEPTSLRIREFRARLLPTP